MIHLWLLFFIFGITTVVSMELDKPVLFLISIFGIIAVTYGLCIFGGKRK